MPPQDITAQTADGVTHSFPAGTPDAVVDKAIKGYVSTKANGVDIGTLQNSTLQQAHRRSLVPMQYEGMEDGGGGAASNRETGVVSPMPPLRPKGETLGQGVTRELGPDAKWVGGAIGSVGGVPGAMLGGAAGEAGNQLLQHAFTPETAPKSSLRATGRMALAAGETGAAELVPKVIGKVGGAVVRRVLGGPASEVENAAAQRALNPSPKGQEAFQKNLEGARPYLGGGKTRSFADLKANAPAVQNEIWEPYAKTMEKIGPEPVQGPDGETTYSALEARRKELSAQLQALNSKDPVAAQTIIQQGKTPAGLLDEQSAIEGLLDERMRREGLNSPLLRKTWGNVEGIERLTSGRNLLTEEPKKYGFGRMAEDLSLNPRKSLSGISAGLNDIAAGRPLWKGKPTDVGIREGFRSTGEKPTFQTTTSPEPLGPETAPPGPSGPPPPVPPQFAVEGTGRPTNANITSRGRAASAQVTQLPTEHHGEGDYAGLLPGPPAPFVPPPPRPPVPQVGGPPPVGFPPALPNPMWEGGQPSASFNSPQQMVATPPPNSHLPYEPPPPTNAPVETQTQTPFYSGSKNAANVYPGSVSFHPPVAPPAPPGIPSTRTGAPPPSGLPPAPNDSVSTSASAPPVLPPVAPPAPINPQEVADFTQILRSHGYQGPITPENINDLMRQGNAIRSNSAPNQVDTVSRSIEARRALLPKSKDLKR